MRFKSLFDAAAIQSKNKNGWIPLVIPPSFFPLVYKELHVDMGHLGVEHDIDVAKD